MTARKFFFKLFLLLAAVVVIDFGIGIVFDRLNSRAKGGNTGRLEYVNSRSDESVLVFGSSRAFHHYDPRVFEDKLGMTAYNCGADGQGIINSYMILSSVLSRYSPEIAVYDLFGPFDFLQEDSNSQYLDGERPYYGRGNAAIDSVYHLIDPAERWKMQSNAYRYNSKWMHILSDNIRPRQCFIKGYGPLSGEGGEMIEPEPVGKDTDPVKMEYLRRFAEKCRSKGVRMVAVVSPYYFEPRDCQIPEEVREILERYGVEIYDFSADRRFTGHDGLFVDSHHLNERGAAIFTGIVADTIARKSLPE